MKLLIVDTSNVSVGDLENIQETDTPPQSPTDSQVSAGDTIMFNLASSTASYRRKADSDVTEDTDVESISPSHKISLQSKQLDLAAVAEVEPTTLIYPEETNCTSSKTACLTTPPRPSTPAPSEELSPQISPSHSIISDPTSTQAPLSALSSPSHTARSFSPKRSPLHHAATLPPRVGSPTEELARLQKEQPRRIAEYNAGSLTELRDLHSSPSPTLQRKDNLKNFQPSKQVDRNKMLA